MAWSARSIRSCESPRSTDSTFGRIAPVTSVTGAIGVSATSGRQSTIKPPVRLATVPVIALALSEARKAANSATSATDVKRFRCVMPSTKP
ncbi:DUF1490 domain-containing protein [Rhizobium sullae]|uniref:DUF1490 domain-containing protein n=1 Tax=Rhizobium sullae TaxID=50338 RepID=A0A2N0DDD1_RHISU|nr:DUF1490 domain-containing protein [Rhizobium sullae]